MANLSYTGITSLDGHIADETGNFDWSIPDEEVHAFVNDLERPVGTYLLGRRLYEVMVAWETMERDRRCGHGVPARRTPIRQRRRVHELLGWAARDWVREHRSRVERYP